MGRFLVRITIVFVALYLVLSYIIAQFGGVDILAPYYNLLFELCVVIYAFSEGKYHCKYIKYTALSILFADILTYADNYYDFLTVEAHNLIPVFIIAIGILTGVTLAIRHYINVRKIKKQRYARNEQN
jgi:hypothetical protein